MPTAMIAITMRTATLTVVIVVVVARNTVANVNVKIQVTRTLNQVNANIYYIHSYKTGYASTEIK